MANGAREKLREEVGDEVADIDLRKFDPRQYDPRRIIKDALLDDFEDAANAAKGVNTAPSAPAPVRTQAPTQVATAVPLAAGEPAPFDNEAT